MCQKCVSFTQKELEGKDDNLKEKLIEQLASFEQMILKRVIKLKPANISDYSRGEDRAVTDGKPLFLHNSLLVLVNIPTQTFCIIYLHDILHGIIGFIFK